MAHTAIVPVGHNGNLPLPSAVKKMRGTYRRDRAPAREPSPAVTLPPCPKFLDDEARREWRRIGKQLCALGVVTSIDRSALAAYCQTWSRWVAAEEQVTKRGAVITRKTGVAVINPHLIIAGRLVHQMVVFLREFGLTPSARTRINAAPVTHEDEAERFFN